MIAYQREPRSDYGNREIERHVSYASYEYVYISVYGAPFEILGCGQY